MVDYGIIWKGNTPTVLSTGYSATTPVQQTIKISNMAADNQNTGTASDKAKGNIVKIVVVVVILVVVIALGAKFFKKRVKTV
jgi:hypothetical protein